MLKVKISYRSKGLYLAMHKVQTNCHSVNTSQWGVKVLDSHQFDSSMFSVFEIGIILNQMSLKQKSTISIYIFPKHRHPTCFLQTIRKHCHDCLWDLNQICRMIDYYHSLCVHRTMISHFENIINYKGQFMLHQIRHGWWIHATSTILNQIIISHMLIYFIWGNGIKKGIFKWSIEKM